jgi:hypothetical protein
MIRAFLNYCVSDEPVTEALHREAKVPGGIRSQLLAHGAAVA